MRVREDDTLDPQVERELAAVEAALAGDAVDPDLADLADLAGALREMRATPPEAFAAGLDRRAAAGFPGAARRPGAGLWERFRSAPLSRRLVPAGAVAVCAVVVATAVVSVGSRDDSLELSDGGGSGATSATEIAPAPGDESAEEAVPASGAPATSTAGGTAREELSLGGRRGGAAGTGPFASGQRPRFVERSAELVLGTEAEDVQRVADDVFGVVERFDGIVLSSSIEEGGEGRAGAEFSLLIPSARLGDALADLSEVAEVRSREETTQDITAPVVSVRERLRDARAEVEGLLKQLADADTDEERAAVKAQLGFQRQRIAGLRAAKNDLERRANLSRVQVEVVTGDAPSFGGDDAGAWGIGDAVDDAGRLLGVAAGVTLVGLAVVAPFALLLALALLGRRVWVRQGRERALEG